MNSNSATRGLLPPGHLRRAACLRRLVFFLGVAAGVNSCLSWQAAAVETDEKLSTERAAETAYTLATYRQSYFKLDAQGALEAQDKLPHRSEKTYRFRRTIRPSQTAIVIMDPWVDMASEHLNKYYGKIVESRVLPLVRHALKLGHPIIVLTNSPDVVKYNTKVHPELVTRAAGGEVKILYHQDMDDDGFASYLGSRKIDTLVYTGFASNMCVIGRQMGMIPMVHQGGFRLFFVPEASAAVELPDTWQDQSVHHATTKIISQWIAEIVEYDEFMGVAVTSPPRPE